MSQAAQDFIFGDLNYQFVQDETYQLLDLFLMKELVSFKKLLVI